MGRNLMIIIIIIPNRQHTTKVFEITLPRSQLTDRSRKVTGRVHHGSCTPASYLWVTYLPRQCHFSIPRRKGPLIRGGMEGSSSHSLYRTPESNKPRYYSIETRYSSSSRLSDTTYFPSRSCWSPTSCTLRSLNSSSSKRPFSPKNGPHTDYNFLSPLSNILSPDFRVTLHPSRILVKHQYEQRVTSRNSSTCFTSNVLL